MNYNFPMFVNNQIKSDRVLFCRMFSAPFDAAGRSRRPKKRYLGAASLFNFSLVSIVSRHGQNDDECDEVTLT